MNRLMQCASFLTVSLIPTAFAESPAEVTGGFETGRYGHVLVPVSIEGGPTRPFAVDTAASHIVLDTSTYADLPGDTANPHGGGTAHGAHGALTTTAARLDSVALWGQEQTGLEAVVLSVEGLGRSGKPDFAGVLGIPYLSRFQLDIDFRQRTLALRKPESGTACEMCRPQEAIALGTLPGGLVSLSVTVDGEPLIAVLDTGASASVLNGLAGQQLAGADGALEEPLVATVMIGRTFVSAPVPLQALELPVFAALGLNRKPTMKLGLDVLASGRLVLDLRGRSAWFPQPGRGGDI